MNMVLIKPETITPKYIKALKAKYNLSWSDLAGYCGYTPNGNALLNAVRAPEKYLTALMQKKIMNGVAKLEKERGHIHEVTSFIPHVPKRFRIAGPPVKCLGHNEPTFNLPKSGFCSDECKELYQAKKAKRK